MNILVSMSNMIIPLVIFYIVAMGLLNKQDVYSDFIEGAEDGFKTVVKIMPTLVGLMMGVGILRASGFLTMLSELIKPVTNLVGFPFRNCIFFILRRNNHENEKSPCRYDGSFYGAWCFWCFCHG